MSEQYAVVTGADTNQIDRTWESTGLSAFETGGKISLSALGRREYKKEIIGSFKQGSGGRSYRYYSFNNLKHAQQDASVDLYRLPVYGVRGTSGINRAIGYACVYISSSQDMAGLDFYSHIFGSRYLTEEEIRTTQNPVSLTEQKPVMPDLRIKPENRVIAFTIVEQLYRIQEQDPNSKLLLIIDDAETASMDLLKDVYLLLPRKMRLNYGFATNITVKTYEELFQQQSLPIQLLTMDSEAYQNAIDKIKTLDPLLSVLKLNEIKTSRSELFKQMEAFLKRGINPQNDLLFAFAEQEVIKRNNNIPSMQFYPEIISKYLDNIGVWWKNTKLNSIEALEKAYGEQQILMEDDVLREEAISSFYLHMIPEGEFAREIAYMQMGQESNTLPSDLSSKADRCLKFMRDKIRYGKIIDAVNEVISWMKQKRDEDLETAKKEHDKQVSSLKSDIDLQKIKLEDYARKTRQLEQKNVQLEDQNKKLKTDVGRYSSNGYEKSSYDRLKDDYDNLQDKYKKQQKEYREENDDLERKAKIGKILSIIFGALFGLTAIATAAFYATQIKPEQKRQKQEIEKLQTSIETEREQVSSLESELNENKQQRESAEQQVTILLSEKELQESKKNEQLAGIDETETEGLGETLVLSNGYTDANGDFKDDITGDDIAPIDENGDGYDDNTGWFIDYEKRTSNGMLEGEVGPIRKVLEGVEGESEPRLLSTLKDNSVIKLYDLKKNGTISFFDVNGDWIDDLSGVEITQPVEGYHEETGWLKGWIDNAEYNDAGEQIATINGMDETGTDAKPICDYSKIKELNSDERGTNENKLLAGGEALEVEKKLTTEDEELLNNMNEVMATAGAGSGAADR